MGISSEETKTSQKRLKKVSPYNDENINACLQEMNMVNRCMSKNNYDKDMCSKEMDNYKGCKKFWTFVQNDRKKKNIEPKLPLPEDREKIRQEYLHGRQWKPQ